MKSYINVMVAVIKAKKTHFCILLITNVLISISSCQKKEAISKIEFLYIKNQIVLSVKIGEEGPFNMLLDTGVDPSAIDFETATSLSLPLDTLQGGNAQGRGNDKVVVFPAIISSLTVKNKNYGDIDALTLKLEKLGSPLGIKLHGILGYSFLKNKIVRINYRDRILQILDSKNELIKLISDDSYTTNFIQDGEDMIPLLESFTLNGKRFIGSLDTGSSLNVQVYMHHNEKFGIKLDTTKKSEIRGVQGKKKVFESTINSFQIDKFSFKDQVTKISTIKNKRQLRMGNIGNKFLQNFIVSFNYLNKEVTFEKY